MFRNYFKTSLRLLLKNKAYSAINITGLAISMAACIAILLFVTYERSFDNFHTKNIYRLNEVQQFEGMVASQKVALSMFPMGPTLKEEFPEIRNFTRVISNIQWWVFAVAAVAAIVIAFLAVGSQSVRAALANPVKSLKSE